MCDLGQDPSSLNLGFLKYKTGHLRWLIQGWHLPSSSISLLFLLPEAFLQHEAVAPAPGADVTNQSLLPSPWGRQTQVFDISLQDKSIRTGRGMDSTCHPCTVGPHHACNGETEEYLLGPFTVTPSSPLPADLVSTLKSAVSRMRTPLGCRPRPLARQAFGLQAASTVSTSIQPFIL